ncbi:MAG TPA: carboxypeptidase-like regulatory domain-containing protein [Candidatus Angelobacter sp.]|nr:carboxypeptidase-like regulatory domain-containing protein [Candidatus Angelobacter sp.]
MRRAHSIAAFLLLVLLLTGPVLFAQSATGEVNGTIVDSSGSVVPGAKVNITNQGTKITNATTSNGNGYFHFLNLRPGIYVLTVEMAGFKKVETAPFDLAVNQTLTQPVTLGVGGVTEVVEVTAQAPMLQVSSSELGTVIPQKAVNDLPLNGRNFTQLLTLTPGATPVSTAQGSSVGVQDAGISAIPSSSFSKPAVHGQVNRSTLYFLDGIINTDLRGPVYGVLPIIDTIDEFKVQSHNDKAEYGGVLGGVVNVASKSGGNNFHGSAWEFVRNNIFDARDGFKDVRLDPATGLNVPVAAAPFHQNEYGGTFGGPIHKNKTFFYVGYEGWRFSKPTQNQARIPTMAELSGDFTLTPSSNKQIFNPFSTFKNGTKFQRNPFRCDAFGNPLPANALGQQAQTGTPCLKLPSSLINPAMQAYLQAYLLAPNAALANGDNFIETRPLIDNANSWMARVDHHISDRDSVFFRFSQMLVHHLDHVIGTVEEQPSDYHANNFGGGWVHSFRSNLVMDVSGGVLRKPYVFNQAQATIGIDKLKSLGFSVDQFNGLVTTLGGAWFGNEIGNRGNSIRNNPDWSAAGNLDWTHGKHNFRFGGQYVWLARDQINTFQTFGFSGALTGCPSTPCPGTTGGSGGLSLASALLGFPSSSSGELPAGGEVNFSLATYSIYGEDQWKILPTLTLNIGLRWDFTTTPSIANNRLSNGLDLFHQQWLIGSSPLPSCGAVPQNPCLPAGFFTDPHQANIIFTGKQSVVAPGSYNNYGPRFGFAWQPMRNTVVRGGIGIYWDTVSARSQYVQNDIEAAQWPWVRGFSGAPNSTGNAGAPGFPLIPLTAVAGNLSAPVPPSPWNSLQSTFFDDPRYQDPWSEQWNLAIERQLSPNTLLSVGYVGSRNGHMAYTGNANTSPLVSASNTATVDNLRAIPWMPPSIHYSQSIGYGNYNSLQVKFQRNFSRGLMTLVSYTWSKSLDTSSGYFGVENGAGQNGSSVQNYFDPRSNYSVSGFDVPHFFSWYTVYELPFGHGKRWLQGGPMSWLFGNLQTNYIFQARSGQPFNLNVNGDPASISGVNFGTLSGYARPNLIGNPIPGNQTADQWFDPNAFAVPSGSFGNFGRNGLRSAHVVNMDVSLFKNVPLGEKRQLQLRAEGFNVFNIQSLAAPTGAAATIGNAQVGKITSIVGTPRQLQFGARFIF